MFFRPSPFSTLFLPFLIIPSCIFRKRGYIILSFHLHPARWCNGSTSDSGSFSLGSSPGRAATFDTLSARLSFASPSSRGLGHQVLILVTWVRIPLGMPFFLPFFASKTWFFGAFFARDDPPPVPECKPGTVAKDAQSCCGSAVWHANVPECSPALSQRSTASRVAAMHG